MKINLIKIKKLNLKENRYLKLIINSIKNSDFFIKFVKHLSKATISGNLDKMLILFN